MSIFDILGDVFGKITEVGESLAEEQEKKLGRFDKQYENEKTKINSMTREDKIQYLQRETDKINKDGYQKNYAKAKAVKDAIRDLKKQ
jgi:hypothetical protein